VSWLAGLGAAGIWIAYLACGVLIARNCAAGSVTVRAFYWVLPIAVATTCISLFYYVAEYSKTALGVRGWWLLVGALALFGYVYQWILQMYIFKCGACGATYSTYRVAWRRGVYTCPHCKRQYFKGVMGPA
jgi:hypothetical protein